jgi:hypothetical protein
MANRMLQEIENNDKHKTRLKTGLDKAITILRCPRHCLVGIRWSEPGRELRRLGNR